MDLSGEVTAALRLLGDASKIELAKYQEVLQKVTEDIAKDTPANSSAPHPAGKEDERIIDATKAVELHRTAIQSKLASLGTFPPHVVDIDWKLSYQVRSSDGEEGGGAMYLVTLHTEESRGKRGKITFSCSLAQLTHLVTRLRQASRCVQKYASNS
ncbi:COMM domain-containing protein 3 [Portunus trituberculatus]|uniref:COMM domain-containing protein 3 n=1 Tax=Portunus trituberculatus TaxID=210409 RepID=A0A5B7EPS4_PORTR|nr:COMM domain-containing protein 3 [Portunus trituberculatus]